MKTAVVIVEREFLTSDFYLGRSGDGMFVNFFFRNGFRVILVEACSMQGNVEHIKAFILNGVNHLVENVYNFSVFQEYLNICNGNKPSNGSDIGLNIGLEFEEIIEDIPNFDVLISRAMPQSLSNFFLQNFKILSKKAKIVPQNMENICLYKDKVIPYLLQSNEERENRMYKLYSENAKEFKDKTSGDFSKIAIETNVCDISIVREEALILMQNLTPICVKPFNLFGGIGIRVFEYSENAFKHFKVIEKAFTKFSVEEERLVLLQKAVKNPEFGDIRPFFSCGKFLGAFKRFEPIGKIHNTINGAKIVPICDSSFKFSKEFEPNLQKPFIEAIQTLELLFKASKFLLNEIITGCDFLLDGNQFKLTEINIACPTGFTFLEASNLYINYGNNLQINDIDDFFKKNERIIEKVLNKSLN